MGGQMLGPGRGGAQRLAEGERQGAPLVAKALERAEQILELGPAYMLKSLRIKIS